MKYLFVIYTDSQYKEHLDYFKTKDFYKEMCDNPDVEVMEWGADYHTDYKDLPLKTQKMMKWCSENKEYDYLIKCDDTIFNETWDFYKSRLGKERDGYRYTCDRWGDKSWSVVDKDDNKHYWGLNYIRVSPDEFKIYFDKTVDLNLIKDNLTKKKSKFSKELEIISKKLDNKSFVERAPKHIVEQEKNTYNELKKDINKINLTIKSLQ